MSFSVLGTGSYLPAKIVSNNDLSELVDTSDEWITQRVGISERHISTDETAADMAYHAAMSALENAGVMPDELDLIIAATLSSDNICPTVASEVQRRIGASCPAFDINAACSGFVFGLDIACGFFERGVCRKALVIGAERLSKLVDWNDRSTCVIFGDGSGAAVLGSGDGYISSKLFTKGDSHAINILNDTGRSVFYKREPHEAVIKMNGQETFKFAVSTIVREVNAILNDNNLTYDNISYFVLHQANTRIIQFAAKKLGVDIRKFPSNIEKYGNTSSASVPVMLDELNRNGALKKGDLLVLSAFGGGLTAGTCLIKW